MIKNSLAHKRSWVTTIVAGIVAVCSFYLAYLSFKPDPVSILTMITIAGFGVLAATLAIQGRPKTLRELFGPWFYIP